MSKHVRVSMFLTLSVLAAVGLAGFRSSGRILAQTVDTQTFDGPRFQAELRGAQEVPPVRTFTFGRVRIQFNEALTRAVFDLDVENGRAITQSHIHCGPRGQNGPIVVWLAGAPPNPSGWNVDGDWVGDAEITGNNIVEPSCGETLPQLARAIGMGLTYVNVHSFAFPGGVVRGQLQLAPTPPSEP